MAFRAFLGTCALFSATLNDTLLRIADVGAFQPLSSLPTWIPAVTDVMHGTALRHCEDVNVENATHLDWHSHDKLRHNGGHHNGEDVMPHRAPRHTAKQLTIKRVYVESGASRSALGLCKNSAAAARSKHVHKVLLTLGLLPTRLQPLTGRINDPSLITNHTATVAAIYDLGSLPGPRVR